MSSMKKVREVIVVEGRYDKNTVSQVVSGTIIETSGFGIFSDKDKLALLRKLAEKRGLIIFTDSDGAGFFIRGRLRGMLKDSSVKHAYIPDIVGRERRKAKHSNERKLGVEGMNPEIILDALKRAGATFEDSEPFSNSDNPITKADLFEAGLSGRQNSAQKRRELLKTLNLPERLSTNGLLDVLNALYTRDELFEQIFIKMLDK